MTHGARQLRAWLDREGVSQETLAARLTEMKGSRVYQSTVSAWLRGAQLPLWAGLAIERIAGIDPAAWTEPAESETDVMAAAAKAS